jgi:hypothetical protein
VAVILEAETGPIAEGSDANRPEDSGRLDPEDSGRLENGCPDPVRLYAAADGKRLMLPCGRRLCSWCGVHVWRKRVLAGLHAGLRAAPPAEYLAILLTAPGDVSAEAFNRDASRKWHRFVEYLRRDYPGARLEFWRVAELQARGHVHFHFVLRGLRWLDIGKLRKTARSAGFGSWVGVRRPKDYKGSVRSLGWYFTKYLLKDYRRTIGGVTKLVTFSNGWRAGWKRAERERVRGRWLYAGPRDAGWRLVGLEGSPSPGGGTIGPSWVAWWARPSWQSRRAAEHESVAIWT